MCLDKTGMTPLHWVAYKGHANILKKFRPKFDFSRFKDKKQATLAHHASLGGHNESLGWLLTTLYNGNLDSEDIDKQTPIFYSIKTDSLDCFDYLMTHNAKWNHVDIYNESIFHLIGKFGAEKCLKSFFDRNEKLTPDDYKKLFGKNLKGKTPFAFACAFGHPTVLQMLLQKTNFTKEKVRESNDFFRRSLFHFAARSGNNQTFKILKNHFGGFPFEDQNFLDKDGQNPIHYAAKFGNAKIIPLLKDHFDMNCRDKNSETPLMIACRFGKFFFLKKQKYLIIYLLFFMIYSST